MANYPGYGKVCCFKGFDEYSYKFNSGFPVQSYDSQFTRIKRYIDNNFDVFGYVVLTTDNLYNVQKKISVFMDKLQSIKEELPLRTIPLKILEFSPTKCRMGKDKAVALINQYEVLNIWRLELEKRYSKEDLQKNIVSVK